MLPVVDGARVAPPKRLPLCASVHLGAGIVRGPEPTTPAVFAGPQPANWSLLPNVYRISLLGTTYCVQRYCDGVYSLLGEGV